MLEQREEQRLDHDDLSQGPGVWRYAMASRAHVVIDAAPYYALMQEAMTSARERIMLVGWDFDTRISLGEGRRWWHLKRRNRPPRRLGDFIVWLVHRTPSLQICILKWRFTVLAFLLRGPMLLDIFRWYITRQIDFKFDDAHPLGCSHHQKIVVIDDTFAVCGGIDMATCRWDTPEHIEHDRRRLKPGGQLYTPWHDVTVMLEGEAAGALGTLARKRWDHAGGKPLASCTVQNGSAWPETLEAEFRDVEVGIARTRAEHRDCPEIREIERLFAVMIGRARRFIYAESQYFASRVIAEAIARRLEEPDPPEIVLVNPLTADGWLEQRAMDGARARLVAALGQRDPQDRFRIYVPYTGETPIYVHAKVMIVDDEVLRVGSANMNNRSQGLDSECDVFIDAARPANRHAGGAIREIRLRLLGEHCGLEPIEVADLIERHGSMAAMIASLPRNGTRRLELLELPTLGEAEKVVADNALLDPERPEEMFEPIARRRGLFGHAGALRKPWSWRRKTD